MSIKFKEAYNFTQNTIQFKYTENSGNRVKNLKIKKKMKGFNSCCFSMINVKICAKQNVKALKVALALKM